MFLAHQNSVHHQEILLLMQILIWLFYI